ncbi:MAG: hypothetical protein HY831_00695 [Candidatus Aenigmarchaeota archaeon]|nr:hypothetical protein [Candidatus Aenigmarchaeota archaeon]
MNVISIPVLTGMYSMRMGDKKLVAFPSSSVRADDSRYSFVGFNNGFDQDASGDVKIHIGYVSRDQRRDIIRHLKYFPRFVSSY